MFSGNTESGITVQLTKIDGTIDLAVSLASVFLVLIQDNLSESGMTSTQICTVGTLTNESK